MGQTTHQTILLKDIDNLLLKELKTDMINDMSFSIGSFIDSIITKKSFDDVFESCNLYLDSIKEEVNSLYANISSQEVVPKSFLAINDNDYEYLSAIVIHNSNIITNNGSLYIGNTSSTGRKAEVSQISIETNGYIGNTKECYMDSDGLSYIGELSPMIFVSGLLNESMCMIELINAQEEVIEKIGKEFFMYDNTCYISNETELKADIIISLNQASYVNSISFIDSFKSPFRLSIKLFDQHGNIQKINDTMSNGTNFFNIPRQKLSKCVISISQNIGITKNIAYSDNLKLSDIGVHIKEDKIVHPSLTTNESSYNLKNIFKKPSDSILATSFSACIGSLVCSDVSYEERGTIIQEFKYDSHIKSVSLTSNEIKTDEHKVEYFISHNNSEYEKISPLNYTEGKEINKIIFSHSLSATSANSKTISIPVDIDSFYLKIVLKTNNNKTTPIVSSINVNVEK